MPAATQMTYVQLLYNKVFHGAELHPSKCGKLMFSLLLHIEAPAVSIHMCVQRVFVILH